MDAQHWIDMSLVRHAEVIEPQRCGHPRHGGPIDALLSSGFLTERPAVLRTGEDSDTYLVRDPDNNAIELQLPRA